MNQLFSTLITPNHSLIFMFSPTKLCGTPKKGARRLFCGTVPTRPERLHNCYFSILFSFILLGALKAAKILIWEVIALKLDCYKKSPRRSKESTNFQDKINVILNSEKHINQKCM
jgi:hypothetical protein